MIRGFFDILPLRKGLKEYLKIREGGEKGKTKSKKRQREECCSEQTLLGMGIKRRRK